MGFLSLNSKKRERERELECMIIAVVQKKAEKRKGANHALHTNTRVCVSFVAISSGLVDKKLAEVQKKRSLKK